jgi:succinate-acetate transporter protein
MQKPCWNHRLSSKTPPSIRGPLLLDPRAAGTEESKTLRVLDAAFNNILGVGIIAFEVYAYILQFQKFEAADRLIWIMLILTVLLIVIGLASGFQYNKAARR